MNDKNKKLLWILLALVLAAALVGAGFFLAHRQAHSGPVTNVDPNFEFEDEQVRETADAEPMVSKGIRIPGYSIIPIKANATDVEIEFYNPEENEVYFQISVLLKGETPEENEKIYESKLLKPGQHIYNVTLTRGLPAGDYPVIIQYATFSADETYTPRNGATVDCVIRAH